MVQTSSFSGGRSGGDELGGVCTGVHVFAGEAFLWGETVGLKLPWEKVTLGICRVKTCAIVTSLVVYGVITVLRLFCCNMCAVEVF